jgi:succinate dehydrogenase assembly factor 1
MDALTAAARRQRVLALYRDLFRVARAMPTRNRAAFIKHRAREDFRKGARVDAAGEVDALLAYGDTMLDVCRGQAEHLTNLLRDPRAHGVG